MANDADDTCYDIETLHFSNWKFSRESIDATYILTMKGSRRLYRQNIVKFLPTQIVHIQHNKGFRNCKKDLCENSSNYDIAHAVDHCFMHAKKRGYGNVLVLETTAFVRHSR